jgi:hypothetical protein
MFVIFCEIAGKSEKKLEVFFMGEKPIFRAKDFNVSTKIF